MKVLVIDDEELIRRTLVHVAESFDFTVKEAQDSHEGERIWCSFQPDLVFVDVLMPGQTGPELIKTMSKRHSSKIVLMSALTQDYDTKKAQALGADWFVGKPFDNIFDVFQKAKCLIDK